jgi:hypothetical protein
MVVGMENRDNNLLNICLGYRDNLTCTYINNRIPTSVSTLYIVLYTKKCFFWDLEPNLRRFGKVGVGGTL